MLGTRLWSDHTGRVLHHLNVSRLVQIDLGQVVGGEGHLEVVLVTRRLYVCVVKVVVELVLLELEVFLLKGLLLACVRCLVA